MFFYDRRDAEYEIDAPRAIADLSEMVPIAPEKREEAVLAAAAFVDEYDLTPFDALHAGIVTTGDEGVLSSERDCDTVGLERAPLEGDSDE